ncbi:MAG: hypothetical protein ACOC1F_04105, partial [Myxococcota bacterium]
DILRDWLEKKKVLEAYPLTAPYVLVFTDMHGELVESTKYAAKPLTEKQKTAIRKLLAHMDKEWDHAVRVIHGAYSLMALAFPEKKPVYDHALAVMFPTGLAIVNTSYRNEAGETERIANRVASDPAVASLLEDTKLSGVPLTEWYETLLDMGRKIGPTAAKLEVPPERTDEIVREFRACQSWTSMVTTFRRTCELAGWSAQDMASFFDQVDRLSNERETGGGAVSPAIPVGGSTDHG